MQTSNYTIEQAENGWMRLSLDMKLDEGECLRGAEGENMSEIMESGAARWAAVSRAIYEELVEKEKANRTGE